MTEELTRLRAIEWILAAAVGLIGSLTLFDSHAGLNGGIWVTLAVTVTLTCRRSAGLRPASPPVLLGVAAVLTAGAATRTTDVPVHVGIGWLTAFLLAAFLSSVLVDDWEEIGLARLVTSPFLSAARVATSSVRELGSALRAATDSPSRPVLRRVLLVAPVVIVLLILLGGADPVIHSVVENIGLWLPKMTISPRAPFFAFLFLVMVGACSRQPELRFAFPARPSPFRNGPTAKDAAILVGSTLATLVLFLILQTIYLFVQPPSQIGNGVTYAEYARRGFGQLCVVVTIVAAVILFAEKFRGTDHAATRTLRRMEFASTAAAALILLSALRRVVLYEQAYGYTVARVHATAYIVFMAGVLVILATELRGGEVTRTLVRRSGALALVLLLVTLYWNDQAWIMDRNIDRVRTNGKFDVQYAASLSDDAFPTVVRRKDELPPSAWEELKDRAACKPLRGPFHWYEWNSARAAAQRARETLQLPAAPKCSHGLIAREPAANPSAVR